VDSELWIAADANLAAQQNAVHSGAAVDNDRTTSSCTDDDQGQPWWAVDLGAPYIVMKVVILMPDVNCMYIDDLASFASQ